MAHTPKNAFSARGSALPLEQLDPREDEASWLKCRVGKFVYVLEMKFPSGASM
jgi:hypothetical protein